MNQELPQGWAFATLGEIADLTSGAGFPEDLQRQKGYPLPFFKVGNLKEVASGEALIDSHHTVSEEIANSLHAKIIPQNAVVFAKIGMAIVLNRRRLIGRPSCIDNNMMAAIATSGIMPRYLLRFLETVDLLPLSQSTTVPSIRKSDLEQIALPLPPLAEQQRIVAKLEILLGKVDACRKRLEKIPVILKRFRQSVLAAACSGRLTADWREEHPGESASLLAKLKSAHQEAGGHKKGNAALPSEDAHDLSKSDLPESWEIAEMRDLAEPSKPITYGILKPGPDLPDGILYVRVADYPNDKLNLLTVRRTSKEIEAAFSRARLREGDILLSIRGTVGRVCTVPKGLEGANITQDTARLGIQHCVDSRFVTWFLRALPTQHRMERATKGAAVRGINIGDVRALQVPIPPLSEQNEIVRRVEALFALADQIETRFAKAKTHVDRLTQSILAKAFRGDLLPQDPNDEPATVLLERIRLQRQETGALRRQPRHTSVRHKKG